jgi:hypothetical protein
MQHERKEPLVPTYHWTVSLTNPEALVSGTIQLATRGHDNELFMGDWEVLSVAEIGEPILAIELGDGDAILTWEAIHYDALSEAIDCWVDRLDWPAVAMDKAALAADRA